MTKKQPREQSRPRNRRPLKDAVYFVCEGEEEKLMVHAASPNRVDSARVVSTPGLRTRPDFSARQRFHKYRGC